MAFQSGTRVDPRLLDYSGYAQGMTQASAIQATALADLGNRIGEAIEEAGKKKADKEIKKGLEGLLKSNPEFAATLGITPTPSVGEAGELVVTQPTDEAYKIGADTIFKTFGRDASKALYGQALLSTFEDDDDDDDLYDPKKIDSFMKSVESESLKDLYKIKDNKLFRRVKGGKDIEINIGDIDPILDIEGAEEFLKLGEDPFGFYSD
jgi:hypothetical protein